MEESAEAYHRACVAFEKCVTDVEAANTRMRKVRQHGSSKLANEHYEHTWEQDTERERRKKQQRENELPRLGLLLLA
jgi:hypothetical protein